jgi:RNA polymerase sigma-70 factor (family 1)
METNDLIKAFTEGNAYAFKTIFDILYSRLFHFVTRQIEDRESAQDITAEVFTKLWLKRANFESFEKIRAFVFVAARNACRDFIKNKIHQTRRDKEFLFLCEQDHDQVINMPQSKDFERAEIKGDVLDHLYQEIEKLPDQCKTIFKMSYVDNLKNQQIADQLQIANKTVRNQKVLAIKLLRSAMRGQYLLFLFVQLLSF